jgi:ADP-ribose pyrophosphatase
VPAFTKLGEATIHAGGIITVATGTFRAPGGEEFERDIVHHPGAVSAVPLLDDGQVVLVRQYRASIEGDLLEIPAGKRDIADEPPELTARRELVEEVGYEAGRIELLGCFYNSPGFSDELSYTYLARDLTHVGTQTVGPEEEHMTVETVALDAVPDLIAAGEIVDAKTIIGLLLARERLAE